MSSPRHQLWLTSLDLVARIFLGSVFLYASWGKILHPGEFAQAIANYQILPPLGINITAWLLPWIEVICGIGLITGLLLRGSALTAALLLAVFMGVLGFSLSRGLDVHCGCFSLDSGAASISLLDLARDALLLAIAVLVLFRSARKKQLSPFTSAHP